MIIVMNKIFKGILSLSMVAAIMVACDQDEGNYSYDYENVTKITIDTTGVDRSELWGWAVGDTIDFCPNVYTTGDTADLKYYYFVTASNYQPIQDGNALVYPPADTISKGKDLHYIVDLTPGESYRLYFMVEDTKIGAKAFMMLSSWLSIPINGEVIGIYCAHQKDGHFEIDVVRSDKALILGSGRDTAIWSKNHPTDLFQSDIIDFKWSSAGHWFYMFLEDGTAKRINPVALAYMDESWEDMFYEAPVYNPQGIATANGCDFLINDGKMHVLYNSIAGDRRFPAPVTGSDNIAPWFNTETITSWGHLEGAIDAYQIVYDADKNAFRPYYNQATSLAGFAPSVADAQFDVNNVEGEMLYGATFNGTESMYVMKNGSACDLYVACFNNVKDEGNLARKKVSLAGCPGIAEANGFTSTTAGSAFFYSTGNKVYSFSYSTGQTEAHLLWEGEEGDEATALCLLSVGGFPTAGSILWFGVWNETTQKGKLVEFEIDPVAGTASNMWGPMSAGTEENPIIYEDFGKIQAITEYNGY